SSPVPGPGPVFWLIRFSLPIHLRFAPSNWALEGEISGWGIDSLTRNMIPETLQLFCVMNGGGAGKACKNGNQTHGEKSVRDPLDLPGVECGKGKVQKEMTMQDICNNPDELDDDEDDIEWEPMPEKLRVMKWFCTNCTMVNFDGVTHCH
ncbi:hypothetical protein Dimus_021064, partial [Dionaea muscipula]